MCEPCEGFLACPAPGGSGLSVPLLSLPVPKAGGSLWGSGKGGRKGSGDSAGFPGSGLVTTEGSLAPSATAPEDLTGAQMHPGRGRADGLRKGRELNS